jgi:hypothetical protein
MWKNVTSYSQGEKDRRPRSLELKFPHGFRLVIVWNHLYYPGEWVCHFTPLFECCRLDLDEYEDVELAKQMAVQRVERMFRECLVYAEEAASQHTTGQTQH